jgi:hypothetical protein
MTDSNAEKKGSRLIDLTDTMVISSLKVDGFVNQIIGRLSNDIKETDDQLTQRFGPIGEGGISGREMSLLFISELLPIANAVIRLGAERKNVENTLDHIEKQLNNVKQDQGQDYRLHTMAINVLSVAVLLYILRACLRYVKDNNKSDESLINQWERIRARTSTRLEESLISLSTESKMN